MFTSTDWKLSNRQNVNAYISVSDQVQILIHTGNHAFRNLSVTWILDFSLQGHVAREPEIDAETYAFCTAISQAFPEGGKFNVRED